MSEISKRKKERKEKYFTCLKVTNPLKAECSFWHTQKHHNTQGRSSCEGWKHADRLPSLVILNFSPGPSSLRIKCKPLSKPHGRPLALTPACLSSSSLTSSSLQERELVWKWNKPTLEAEPRGREIHVPGKLFAYWIQPYLHPRLLSSLRESTFLLVSLFAQKETDSLSKRSLQASTDPKGIAESRFWQLSRPKPTERWAGDTVGAEAGAADGDHVCVNAGVRADQDQCMSDWARP